MNRLKILPKIMVAPNGARKVKKDHINIPITIPEIVREAKDCFKNGAKAIHAHVRDNNQNHVLDSGLYNELIKELAIHVPNLPIQITTEAIGVFSPQEQRKVVELVKPEGASVALVEMMPDIKDANFASQFYNWAFENEIQIQHILYSPQHLLQLAEALRMSLIPRDNLQVLFVLGRYSADFQSKPEDLDAFLKEHKNYIMDSDWGVCAFGRQETDCLLKAVSLGGKARIGFENNFYNKDGSLAKNNAERVLELSNYIK